MNFNYNLIRNTLLASIAIFADSAQSQTLTDEEQLGLFIFFDENLSINRNQSCASCHGPEVGWTGPISSVNAGGSVYNGSVAGEFGNRKPPSAAYATSSPILHYVIEKRKNQNKMDALFIGGNFWDGRATGEKLGNPAADQAQGPFLNPVEQALPASSCVVYRVCHGAAYPGMFESVYPNACAIDFPENTDDLCASGEPVVLTEEDQLKVDMAYDQVALAIAAFEASPVVNTFSSKFDAYLAGMSDLSKQERKGMRLFKSAGKCANCHVLDAGPLGEQPLLTDFTFDNLGVPRNPENPVYQSSPDGYSWVDMGLGAFLDTRPEYEQYAEDNYGKQKVPTLRNVDLRPGPGFQKAFAHNGYFKTLKQIVHFYNTRDAKPVCLDKPETSIDESLFTPVEEAIAQGCWPMPEVAENVNTDELGDLHLTDAQEDAIVAFMKTLSDGYLP